MDDFLSLARGRRSIRRYEPREVPQSTLEMLLEAAIWAPSAHNRQPWRFAVVRGASRERLALAMGARLRSDLERDGAPPDVVAADVARSYERLTSAPAVIVLCLTMADMDTYPDVRRQQHEWTMAVQSVAMAGQNLLLAAHAHGLGACWMCAPLFCPDVVQAALDLPTDWQPQGLITLGYPAQTRDKTRQPMTDKVVWR
ncbi:nitroreductase family protein [Aggregatilineales bacterium SYSU G02658]